MRGLAAVIMLQGHVIEAWVRPRDRSSEWFWLSQFLGGLPAPIFLFLVGISLALVMDRMRVRGATRAELAARVLRRGAWVLLLAYAFRIEQFLVWRPASSWNEVFRVDTLNCIAATTLVVGLASAMLSTRLNVVVMGFLSLGTVVLTPLAYRGGGNLPQALLAYLNGGGNPSYFSLIPWAAFALAGMTFGYLFLMFRDRRDERRFMDASVVAGVCLFALGSAMSFFPVLEYGFFDYSVTSPHFFFVRLGWLLLILYGAYRWSARDRSTEWSPMRTFGQASLLVYWVHIEIVYGRLFNANYRALDLPSAAAQLLWLVPAMLLLSCARMYGFGRLWRQSSAAARALLPKKSPVWESEA